MLRESPNKPGVFQFLLAGALRDEQREEAANEHAICRRAVEAEVSYRDVVHRKLAEAFGTIYADQYMAGEVGHDSAGRC
jgi:hypothetical protein